MRAAIRLFKRPFGLGAATWSRERRADQRDTLDDRRTHDHDIVERLRSIDLRAHLRRRRTYPGVFPVLHLDHIYYDGEVEVVKLELPRTRLSLMASDHLPLMAELRVGFH